LCMPSGATEATTVRR